MAKKSTGKETPEASPEKKQDKEAAATAESQPHVEKKSEDEKATEPGTPDSSAVGPEVIEEHIRITAYFRWVERGMTDGGHEEDWIEAEKQIRK
jgi:hypothetical protein